MDMSDIQIAAPVSAIGQIAARVSTTGQLAVRSGIEIDNILNAMIRDHASVVANLPSQNVFFSKLVAADPVKQRVLLAYSGYKMANEAILKLDSVTFKCHHRWGHFGFVCTRPRAVTRSGEAAVECNSPVMVIAWEHKRASAHGKIPKLPPDFRCQLPLGAISLEARLVDMSLDGRAFLIGDPAIPLCGGTWVRGARITPQGAAPVTVDIEVKQVIPTLLPDGDRTTRIACRIVGDDAVMEQMIGWFVMKLE